MSPRLLLSSLAALFLACSLGRAAADDAPARPNILWITCEDASPTLGCYGDEYACTPVLDKLAAEGVRYTNACGITGVCAVNRSSIITGMYSSTIGSHDMRSKTTLPDNIKCFSEYLRNAGYFCTNNSKTDYNFPVPANAWDECNSKAHWRNRKPGQPFFAVFNFTVSHESQIRNPDRTFFAKTARLTDDQRHDPTEAPVPPFHPDTLETRKDWARYYDNVTAMDYLAGDILAQLEEDGLADDTIVFFYSDHGTGMPGIKKWVWNDGMVVPMIVRFPEKFKRWSPGEAGSTCDRLVSFVDLAPTVLSLVGLDIPDHMQGSAFLGQQQGEPRDYLYGIRDRMAERYDTIRLVRDEQFQYMRNFMPHVSWSQYIDYTEQMPTMRVWREMAAKGELNDIQARYFQPTKPLEELYDTANDPHHIHNLADDTAYRAVLERMRAECRRWMLETNDLGLLPEYEMHRRSEGSTPYEVGADRAINPLEKLLAAADVANSMDPSAIPQLVELSKDDDPAIRHWAMMGLVALGDDAKPAFQRATGLLDDESPNVRAQAAEVVANCGDTDAALPVMIDLLAHESGYIRLRAMNALDRMGDDAKPAIPAMRAAKMPKLYSPIEHLNLMSTYVPEKLEKGAWRPTGPERGNY